MTVHKMELRDLRELTERFPISVVTLVPFKHEKRTDEHGKAAIWYRLVFDVTVNGEVQQVALSAARGPLRRFASASSALSFIEENFGESEYDKIMILRHIDTPRNQSLDSVDER